MGDSATVTRLLDTAQHLVQTRGYGGFSYRDLAATIGIKTASIHYHFPTKADLGVAIARRGRAQLAAFFATTDAEVTEPQRKLERYIDVFRHTLADGGRMCLCGMLASEFGTLPQPLQTEVQAYLRDHETWLTNVLCAGQQSQVFSLRGPCEPAAIALFAALEGAMFSARAIGKPDRLDVIARWQIAALKA